MANAPVDGALPALLRADTGDIVLELSWEVVALVLDEAEILAEAGPGDIYADVEIAVYGVASLDGGGVSAKLGCEE